jgi:hypothetical protein
MAYTAPLLPSVWNTPLGVQMKARVFVLSVSFEPPAMMPRALIPNAWLTLPPSVPRSIMPVAGVQ